MLIALFHENGGVYIVLCTLLRSDTGHTSVTVFYVTLTY